MSIVEGVGYLVGLILIAFVVGVLVYAVKDWR